MKLLWTYLGAYALGSGFELAVLFGAAWELWEIFTEPPSAP